MESYGVARHDRQPGRQAVVPKQIDRAIAYEVLGHADLLLLRVCRRKVEIHVVPPFSSGAASRSSALRVREQRDPIDLDHCLVIVEAAHLHQGDGRKVTTKHSSVSRADWL
jgi:hypothetical protein